MTSKVVKFRWLAVVAVIVAMPAAGSAQRPGEEGRDSQTPWGDPDLQGIWEYWTFTPLERPDSLAGQEVLTDEEAAQVGEQRRRAALARDLDVSRNLGSYSQEVWTERGRATALNQPSLIVDPPDGRLPALTRSEEQRVADHRAAGGRPVRTRAVGIGTDGPEDRGLAERCLVG